MLDALFAAFATKGRTQDQVIAVLIKTIKNIRLKWNGQNTPYGFIFKVDISTATYFLCSHRALVFGIDIDTYPLKT